MASIETYRTRIDALKTSVETLKGGGPLTIKNLPGRAPLAIDEWGDLNLPYGTVIGVGGVEYMRTGYTHGPWTDFLGNKRSHD